MHVRPPPLGYRPFELAFGLAEGFGAPTVAYREAFASVIDSDHTHQRITGPSGQFARVLIRFEPLAPGSGFAFRSAVALDSPVNEFIAGAEKGVRAAMISGSVGYPLVDFMATLLDGATHDVDSSILAFEIASRLAFRKAIEMAEMKLLEPVMKVAVTSPTEFIGTVIGDLTSRRGAILSQRGEGDVIIVDAMVPCANLMTYGRDLRSITSGRASCSGEFVGLIEVSPRGLDPEAAAVRMRA